MKKYILLTLILSIISILAIPSGPAHADHYGPQYGDCVPGMYLELNNETLHYDPLLSSDCALWFSTAMSNFYELTEIEVKVEHQRMAGDVWQDGPKIYQISYDNWYLSSIHNPNMTYRNIGGGIFITGYNTTSDRYRLVVTLDGASTHYPTFTTPSDYELRTDQYATGWVYGTEDDPTRSAPDDEPIDRDDIPDEVTDQDNDDHFPTSPGDGDRDWDGIPNTTDQCPDEPGPAFMHGCPASADNIETQQREMYLPATVCTVETSLAMLFIFDIESGEPMPLGTTPLSADSPDLTMTGPDYAAEWSTARLMSNGAEYEYMVNPGWASLVRTGGTCAEFGVINDVTTFQ